MKIKNSTIRGSDDVDGLPEPVDNGIRENAILSDFRRGENAFWEPRTPWLF